jgi:hypothetical protein
MITADERGRVVADWNRDFECRWRLASLNFLYLALETLLVYKLVHIKEPYVRFTYRTLYNADRDLSMGYRV